MPENKCTSRIYSSKIKLEENKRKAVFNNPNKDAYEITKVDGCAIKEGVRCDYFITNMSTASVFVELKGCDLSHASQQLLATAQHKSIKPLVKGKLGFLVICSKFPRFDTSVIKAKIECARKYKAGFHVVCRHGEFDIERVASIDGPR